MTGIIIGGAARAGKSQLAARLHAETGFSWISGDMLISAFEATFPQLGIRHEDDHTVVAEKFFPFASNYIQLYTEWEERPFIFDSFNLSVDQIVSAKLHEKYAMVFLGYPNMDVEQKLADVRAHDPDGDWTTDQDDDKLRPQISRFIDLSKTFRDDCAKHGLAFYDTGADFEVESEKAYQFILSHL